MRPRSRNGQKGKRSRQKATSGRQRRAEPLLEQPIAELNGTVSCERCGHGVDPKRMHIHMVRFHGVALRSKGG